MDIELPYPRDEAYARLARITAPPDFRGRPRDSVDARPPLVGEIQPDGFVVKPQLGYSNGFGALCRGRLEETPSGCRLRAQIGPPLGSLAFLGLWFGALVWISYDQLPAGAPWSALVSGPASGRFLLMAGGGMLVGALGLGLAYAEAQELRRVLARALDVSPDALRGA